MNYIQKCDEGYIFFDKGKTCIKKSITDREYTDYLISRIIDAITSIAEIKAVSAALYEVDKNALKEYNHELEELLESRGM